MNAPYCTALQNSSKPRRAECALLFLCARTSKSAQALTLRDVYVHTAHLGPEHHAEVEG